jgi:hypothetical protein
MPDRKPRRPRQRSVSGAQGIAASRRRSGSSRFAAKAAQEAAALGPFAPVEPASELAADGFPLLGRGQVYAFLTGKVFHPINCEVVMGRWDDAPHSVKVIDESTIGSRSMCGVCAQTAV